MVALSMVTALRAATRKQRKNIPTRPSRPHAASPRGQKEISPLLPQAWSFAARARKTTLAVHPTANVTHVPIMTHHVYGRWVHRHKYSSTANPNNLPTIAPG